MVSKIVLLYVVTLYMIFPLFWNYGNATTPRKLLGVRQNAIADLPDTNRVNYRGSSAQFSLISGQPSVYTNAEADDDPRILSRHNGVTSLQNIKETTSDERPGHRYFTVSSSSDDNENAATNHMSVARHNAVTLLPDTNRVTHRGSAGQFSLISSQPTVYTNAETDNDHRIFSRHNGVTSLQNTKETTSERLGHQYFTISSSSDDYAHATSPYILGARHNAVTWRLPSLSDKATSGVSKHQDSHIPSSLAQTSVAIPRDSLKNPNEATSFDLGKRQYPIIIKSLSNTNEAANSGDPGLLFNYPLSSSPTQISVTHHFHRFSPSQMWHQPGVTPRKIWGTRPDGVTSLSNTYEATSGESEHQYSPISSSSAHANAATPRILQTRLSGGTSLSNTNEAISSPRTTLHLHPFSSSSAQTHATTPRRPVRYNVVTGSPYANEATTRKHGKRENPIIITRSPYTNEAANSGESGLNFFPISSSPAQTNRVFPRDAHKSGHVSSIIN